MMADEVKKEVVIKIDNLYKSYGNHHVIKGLNLEVYKGEVFGFIGPNGAGKSTTIDCMIGAKTFEDGNIYLNNFDISENPYYAKRSFGYTSSEPTTYEMMTGNEYLEFIGDVYEMEEEAYRANLAFLIRKFDFKEADLTKKISSYSHGMKQKIALMASLLYNPDIWIMDEPTVGLDIMVFETLKEMMVQFAKNNGTIFLTSHNIELVAKICDRVALIKDGVVYEIIDLNKRPDARYQLPRMFLNLYKDER